MVAISLSVRALVLTVVTFASFVKIEHPVEDYARIFKLSDRDVIAQRIATLQNLTHAQMAVLTVSSLEGQKIEAFSHHAASAWAGGTRSRNDGLLLVIAPKEHRIRLEVGAGLAQKLTSDRVQAILDDEKPVLKAQHYDNAVLDIINEIEPILRGRGPTVGLGTVVAGALGTAAGTALAKSGNRPPVSAQAAPPVAQAAPDPIDRALPTTVLPPALQFADQTALDSFLMKQFFLLLSLISFILGLVFGRSRLRQDPSGLYHIFSYAAMIAAAALVGWIASVSLGSPRVSPAVLVVTLVQAFSGMRAAMATHLKRIVGPGDDFELVQRVTAREAARYFLPSIGATFVLGAVLRFPMVHWEQYLAILGTGLIGVGHAIGLAKLNEMAATRPLLPPGSYERICTSPFGRFTTAGEHVHTTDDSTTTDYQPTENETDNRGSGGTFNGDGASSEF